MDLISHCIKRNQRVLEGRATAGMLIILVVLSLLGWIYLTQASHVATTSRRVQELEDQKNKLHEENLRLMSEIASLESVSRLDERARELGFVDANLEDADFLLVQELPDVEEQASGDGSLVARWLDNVTLQFAAWVQSESQ
jgi:cell division protein FtsL